ncbi:MAG: hypothetical protein A2075_00865 [Geobacteraceae bacterium GWC2_58_44]|nr:MAG: hypothetical protein A2075_00865 [Geobacteraceae bacterium GWC2_58_44]HBG06248.1 hypothetical protein [Geobacter sp.]
MRQAANDLKGITIADPFMGGGTPLIEANRIGCDVAGYDINPMAYWIVSREIEHLNLPEYRKVANRLAVSLEEGMGALYRTSCLKCGSATAHVRFPSLPCPAEMGALYRSHQRHRFFDRRHRLRLQIDRDCFRQNPGKHGR